MLRSVLFLFIIAATVLVTTFFYARNARKTYTEIDLLQESLQQVKKIIPAGDPIHFVADPFNPTLFPHAQFVLAPYVIETKDSITNGWTLYVWEKKKPVNIFSDTTGLRMCWQQKDSLYVYCLYRKDKMR